MARPVNLPRGWLSGFCLKESKTVFGSAMHSIEPSPPKEPVWIVPFLRLIEIKAVQPSLFRFRAVKRLVKAVKQRCRTGGAHVAQQARYENGRAPICPL